MIKFIIETVTSERDRGGNCYHYAIITRTKDRVSFVTAVGGSSNALRHARVAGLEFDEFYDVQCVIPKRDYRQRSKTVKYRESELEGFFKGEVQT